MSYRKVIELAAELASTYLVKEAVDIAEPAEPPKLYWDARMGLQEALNITEGDLIHLKYRGLAHSIEWKAVVKVREELVNLFKEVNRLHPHDGIRKIIGWIEKEKSNLLKLHNMILKTLQEPKTDFPKQEPKGIAAILDFSDAMQDVLTTEHAQLGSTIPPPRMR